MRNFSLFKTSLAGCLMRRAPMSKKRFASACGLLLFIFTAHMCMTSLVPLSWWEADLSHVVRVISDVQDFPVNEMNNRERQEIMQKIFAGKTGNLSKVYIQDGKYLNVSNLVRFSRQSNDEYYPDFFQKLKTLSMQTEKDSSVIQGIRLLDAFKPIMTQEEKRQLLEAFDVFVDVCNTAGVTYFLLEASLMGIRRHHGMIPWDDDIDIVVNASQWKTLHAILSSIPGFTLFAPGKTQWKFYVDSATPFPDKPFKFPYLDIFFFAEDDDFVWAITQGLKHDLVHKKSDIFPVRQRIFEGRLVPVPNNLPLLVEGSHDVTECITGEYNHKTNMRFYYGGKIRVRCSLLRDVYPFVDRKITPSGAVEESLRIGERLIYRYTTDT